MAVGERVIFGAVHSGSLKSRDFLAGPCTEVVATVIPSPDVANRSFVDVDGSVESGHHNFFLHDHFDYFGLDVEGEGVNTSLIKIGVRTLVGTCYELSLGVKSNFKTTAVAIRLNGRPFTGIG